MSRNNSASSELLGAKTIKLFLYTSRNTDDKCGPATFCTLVSSTKSENI